MGMAVDQPWRHGLPLKIDLDRLLSPPFRDFIVGAYGSDGPIFYRYRLRNGEALVDSQDLAIVENRIGRSG